MRVLCATTLMSFFLRNARHLSKASCYSKKHRYFRLKIPVKTHLSTRYPFFLTKRPTPLSARFHQANH